MDGISSSGEIVVGFVAFEAIGFLLFIILSIIGWPFQRMFFWLIDVVPARGGNSEEAKNIARYGKVIWLDKKLTSDIDGWSSEDTEELVSLLNWRARLFFHGRERLEDRVAILEGPLVTSLAAAISTDPLRETRRSMPWPGFFL